MERLLEVALNNAGFAAVVAVVAALAERFLTSSSQGEMRQPSVVRGLWLLVLLRLLSPPLFELGLAILPAPGAPVGQLSETSGSVLPIFPDPGRPTHLAISVTELTVAFWFAGASAVLTLALARIARLRRWLRTATPAEASLAGRVSELAGLMGFSRAPEVLVVDAAVPPMLWSGFGASRLILPAALLRQTSTNERDTLIVHELAHLRRRDHWARYVELAAAVVYWWHPAAWWACRRLRRAEERCCDALVAETLPEHRRAYADGLVKTLRYLSGPRSSGLAVASGAGELEDLERRLKMIMTRKTPKALSPPARMLLAAAALVLLAVFPTLAQREPLPAQSSVFSGQPVDLDVKNAPVGNVLRALASVSGLNFIIEPGVDLASAATVKVNQVPWDQVLDSVLRINGLAYTIEGNVIWIGPADRPGTVSRPFVGEQIDLRLDDVDLRHALKEFSRWTDLELALEPGIEGKVTLELVGVPWDQALDAVLRMNGLEMTRKGSALEIHAPRR